MKIPKKLFKKQDFNILFIYNYLIFNIILYTYTIWL